MTVEGLAVPTATHFDASGAIDSNANREFLVGLAGAGADHLFVLGSLGEFPSIEDDERAGLVRSASDALRGGTDLWIGVGAPTTSRAVRYTRAAQVASAAAVVAVPPYYLQPTEAAIASYYRAIHAECRVPLLAYNIPAKVGYALRPEMVHRLARQGVIQGIKDTAGSPASLLAFLTGAPPEFAVLPGDDSLVRWAIGQGSPGAVMGTANIAPKLGVSLVRAARSGDRDRVEALQGLVDRLEHAVRIGPFPSTVKFLAHRFRGTPHGYRSPYDALTPAEAEQVLAAFRMLEGELAPFR